MGRTHVLLHTDSQHQPHNISSIISPTQPAASTLSLSNTYISLKHSLSTKAKDRMWLLHTSNPVLHQFTGVDTPHYAIFSHTWGKEEVTFDIMQEYHQTGRRPCLAGYEKVEQCCAKARSAGFEWVWIDTCCVDKRSSAELSEALNSMFRWYQGATICYAYLEDYTAGKSELSDSRWFTRGWTLQELIAPPTVEFLAKDWTEIGTKTSLQKEIARITGVNSRILCRISHVGKASVAKRMSWAARRQTSRLEDEAYCLMGLFGVNMPMLYGEGKMAFERLQLEIIKNSNDHSIFAWNRKSLRNSAISGLLAQSPADFEDCGEMVVRDGIVTGPYSMTNLGLSITLPIIDKIASSQETGIPSSETEIPLSEKTGLYAILNCSESDSSNKPHYIAIHLIKQDGDRVYARASCNRVFTVPFTNDLFRNVLQMYIPRVELNIPKPQFEFQISIDNFQWRDAGFEIIESFPSTSVCKWHEVGDSLQVELSSLRSLMLSMLLGLPRKIGADCACLLFSRSGDEHFLVCLKVVDDDVGCVVERGHINDLKGIWKRMGVESLKGAKMPLTGRDFVSASIKKKLVGGYVVHKLTINIGQED